MGTDARPYRASSKDKAISMSGSLGHTSDTCRIGAFDVETVERLRYEAVHFSREVQSGELRLAGGGTSARARFSPGHLTVVDSTGRSTTYTLGSDELIDTIGECISRSAPVTSIFFDPDGPG
jgi:hypothetical protein